MTLLGVFEAMASSTDLTAAGQWDQDFNVEALQMLARVRRRRMLGCGMLGHVQHACHGVSAVEVSSVATVADKLERAGGSGMFS